MRYLFETIQTLTILPVKLENSNLHLHEQREIYDLAKSSIHHKVIDLILVELDELKQDEFIEMLTITQDDPSLLNNLRSWINNFEEKVRTMVLEAEKELCDLLEE